MTHADIAARFRRDTARHEMTVLHDDGLYRHLRFMQPKTGSSCYWFDLITVPGALIFQGDGTTFAFRRIEDMFQFFRWGIWHDGSLHINPGYWSEKLTTDRDSVVTYSQKLFEEYVAKELEAAEADWPGVTQAWNEKTTSFLAEYSTEYEETAREALDDFEFGVTYRATCSCGASDTFTEQYEGTLWRSSHIKPTTPFVREHRTSVERKDGFRFTDTYDWNLRDFDWWFTWACHAIVWGIARWDKAGRDGLRGLAARTGGAR